VAPGMVPIAGLDAAEQLLLKNSANSSCSCPIPCKRASQPIHLPARASRKPSGHKRCNRANPEAGIRVRSDQAQDQAGAELSIVRYQEPPARFSAPMTRKKVAQP